MTLGVMRKRLQFIWAWKHSREEEGKQLFIIRAFIFEKIWLVIYYADRSCREKGWRHFIFYRAPVYRRSTAGRVRVEPSLLCVRYWRANLTNNIKRAQERLDQFLKGQNVWDGNIKFKIVGAGSIDFKAREYLQEQSWANNIRAGLEWAAGPSSVTRASVIRRTPLAMLPLQDLICIDSFEAPRIQLKTAAPSICRIFFFSKCLSTAEPDEDVYGGGLLASSSAADVAMVIHRKRKHF